MADDSFQEKSEPATPRRREDARKKGQVARSMELNSFAILFVGVMTLFFVMPLVLRQLLQLMQGVFRNSTTMDLSLAQAPQLVSGFLIRLLVILAPLLIALIVAALAVNLAQVGFSLTAEPLQPKPERINLAKGFKRLMSLRSLVDLSRNLIKLTIVAWIAYTAIKAESVHFVSVLDSDPYQLLCFVGMAAFHIGLKIALALLVLGLLDYTYQKWELERSIRMSKQEIKDEVKQYEGSPLTKSRVRRVQQELSRMRQAQEVPNADVVVVNPVHFAVALKYNSDQMGAPTVVAKGARLLAQKIIKIAREHDVPIVENPPLARALYQAVEVAGEIPGHLYKAVAEVLAYVYRLKNPNMQPE